MHKNDIADFQKFMIISWVFKIVQNHQESFKINNFFFPVKAESSYFSDFIMRVRLRARVRAKTIFFWKFFDFGIFSEFPAFKVKLARACARAGAHMKKFEKYELSAFTGKKNY